MQKKKYCLIHPCKNTKRYRQQMLICTIWVCYWFWKLSGPLQIRKNPKSSENKTWLFLFLKINVLMTCFLKNWDPATTLGIWSQSQLHEVGYHWRKHLLPSGCFAHWKTETTKLDLIVMPSNFSGNLKKNKPNQNKNLLHNFLRCKHCRNFQGKKIPMIKDCSYKKNLI